MLNVKKCFTLLLVSLMFLVAVSFSINFVHAQTYSYYQFNGPYYLDTQQGAGSNSVTVNALYVNGSAYSFTLQGTQVSLYSSNQISQITWNASSALNYTSIITFIPANGASYYSINIYIPDPNTPFYQYTFPVTDFVGVTNAYLRMSLSYSTSSSATVEQVSLIAASTPTFTMQQGQTYTLSFICDQGTYSEQFTAETTYTNSLTIFPGMFGSPNATQRTVNAYATNNTNIYATYQDPTSQTTWINFLITDTNTPDGSIEVDYNNTVTASTSTINYGYANLATTQYNVTITDNYAGTVETYIYPIVQAPSNNNPFTSISGLFGQLPLGWNAGFINYLPVDASQGIAIALIMIALCVGSYFSMTLGCGLSWAIGLFLWYEGWWQASVGPIILGGILIGFIIIVEAKKREREF